MGEVLLPEAQHHSLGGHGAVGGDRVVKNQLLLAVQHPGTLPLGSQKGPERTRLLTRIDEHQGLLKVLVHQQPEQQPLLVPGVVGEQELVVDIRVLLAHRIGGYHQGVAQQTVGDDLQVELAHTRNDGLVALRVEGDAEGGILLGEAVERLLFFL